MAHRLTNVHIHTFSRRHVPKGFVPLGLGHLLELPGVRGAAGAVLTRVGTREFRELAARYRDFLRIAINGGGCNGLSYKLRFTAEPRRGDILVRTAGIPVLVDSKTALYLKGTVLDYSDKMIAGGFKFSNPNAKASCSCGESFSV